MDVVLLVVAASATALATGLGAIPVFLLGRRAELLRPVLLGTAIGAMSVASLLGLLKPALDEGGTPEVVLGLTAGVALLVVARRVLVGRDVHVGKLRGTSVRSSVLVFGVLLVHSLPEGLAIGTAYASDRAGLSLAAEGLAHHLPRDFNRLLKREVGHMRAMTQGVDHEDIKSL